MKISRALTLDSFKGALLGTAAGDALGMPVEGWPVEKIKYKYGVLEDMMEARSGKGTYTDDTEMMIALAESLIQKGKVEKSHLAQCFLENFHPQRGYGPGTRRVLGLIREGVDISEAASSVFPGGSFGNGSVMRVAPLALSYFYRKNALKKAAYEQSEVTHSHPLACEAAYLQAYAIGRLIEHRQSADDLNPLEFLDMFLDTVSGGMSAFYQIFAQMRKLLTAKRVEEKNVIEVLGNDITVIHSWPTALYSFLAHYRNFEEAVVYAVNLGGDTDTIGAMTGALAGAFHGASAIPPRWIGALENGRKGREYISLLAERIFRLSRDNDHGKK